MMIVSRMILKQYVVQMEEHIKIHVIWKMLVFNVLIGVNVLIVNLVPVNTNLYVLMMVKLMLTLVGLIAKEF